MIGARRIVSFAAGLVFAVGLGLSGMTQPAKVVGFLDIFGRWDPSLLCVMGAALGVSLVLFPRILRRSKPLLDARFHVPGKRAVDGRLIAGAAIFGMGWGLCGYCPGPAIVSVASGSQPAILFVLAMAAGMALEALGRWSPQGPGRELPVSAGRAPSEAERNKVDELSAIADT
jgi:uncharacterized protein